MRNRLLVVVDARPASDSAIAGAIELAELQQSSLVFVGVVPSAPATRLNIPSPVMFAAASAEDAMLSEVQTRINAGMAEAARRGLRCRDVIDLPGDALQVVSVAIEAQCRMIVIASEGRSPLARLLSGSMIPSLITNAPMPVLVCKAADNAPALVPAVLPRTPVPRLARRRLRTAPATDREVVRPRFVRIAPCAS